MSKQVMQGMLRKMDLTLVARAHGGHLEWEGGEYTFVPRLDNSGALARSVKEWRDEMEEARDLEKVAKTRNRKSKRQTRYNHLDKFKQPRLSQAKQLANHIEKARADFEREEGRRRARVLAAIRKAREGRLCDTIEFRRLDRESKNDVLVNLGLLTPPARAHKAVK